jgi:opacity protein-like surface antigen
MIQTKALLTGMAAAVAFGAAAHAADPPGSWNPGPFSYERPAPRPVEMVSGWYVRGDVGYRFNHVDTLQAPYAITSAKYPDSVGLTFGGGYKYDWFRSDVTVDYAPRVTARAASGSSFSQPQYTAKIDPLSILANVYLDLGTWWGFTPYVGAGAGVTYVHSREYTDTSFLPPNYAAINGRTNFSYAAMAGVSYRIDARWIVDLGYRHLEMGDLPTSTGTNSALDSTVWKRLSTDEVRVGFRFVLD